MDTIKLTEIAQILAKKVDDLETESLYLKSKGVIPDWLKQLGEKPQGENEVVHVGGGNEHFVIRATDALEQDTLRMLIDGITKEKVDNGFYDIVYLHIDTPNCNNVSAWLGFTFYKAVKKYNANYMPTFIIENELKDGELCDYFYIQQARDIIIKNKIYIGHLQYTFKNNYCINLNEAIKKLNMENTSNDLSDIFTNCSNLEEVDLSSWKFNKNDFYSASEMFASCYSLKKVTGLDNILSAMKSHDIDLMFCDCHSLEEIDGTFDLRTMQGGLGYRMFENCYNLQQGTVKIIVPSERIDSLNSFEFRDYWKKKYTAEEWKVLPYNEWVEALIDAFVETTELKSRNVLTIYNEDGTLYKKS